jgi:hypothetical protein
MTTNVRGTIFDNHTQSVKRVSGVLRFGELGMNEWYQVGRSKLSCAVVKDEYDSTRISFVGPGVYFNNAHIALRKGHGKYVEQKLLLDNNAYWLQSGDSAQIINESDGKRIKLVITRERPASTNDRSRR